MEDSTQHKDEDDFAVHVRTPDHVEPDENEDPPPPEPEHGVSRPVTRKPPNVPSRQEVLGH